MLILASLKLRWPLGSRRPQPIDPDCEHGGQCNEGRDEANHQHVRHRSLAELDSFRCVQPQARSPDRAAMWRSPHLDISGATGANRASGSGDCYFSGTRRGLRCPPSGRRLLQEAAAIAPSPRAPFEAAPPRRRGERSQIVTRRSAGRPRMTGASRRIGQTQR
jgi:hypothetical protein